MLLGYDLNKSFTADLVSNPSQASKDLRDGKEFTFEFDGNDVSTKWNGLINGDNISLIAYYVYYKYKYDRLSITTGIGDVKGLSENSERVNEIQKMASAWKKFLELYGMIPARWWFNKYDAVYDTFNDAPSAYNFLNKNRANYTDWLFQKQKRINEFGI